MRPNTLSQAVINLTVYEELNFHTDEIKQAQLSHQIPQDTMYQFFPASSMQHFFLASLSINDATFGSVYCLQCFDAVGWAAGRASGL